MGWPMGAEQGHPEGRSGGGDRRWVGMGMVRGGEKGSVPMQHPVIHHD